MQGLYQGAKEAQRCRGRAEQVQRCRGSAEAVVQGASQSQVIMRVKVKVLRFCRGGAAPEVVQRLLCRGSAEVVYGEQVRGCAEVLRCKGGAEGQRC